jgi:hypothetical protein
MKYLNLILLFSLCFGLNAQTAKDLAQAKLDYKNKEYAKALPVFEIEYKAKPNDPSLNLWYGACLVETNGDMQKAEECLLLASKRNLPESFLYLGDLYIKQYRVSEAQPLFDRFAKLRPRDKGQLTERQERLDELQKNISRTEDIQIIDSLIVDKDSFLKAYKLSSDLGELVEYKYVFNTPNRPESTVYINGTNTKMYFGDQSNNKFTLYSMEKLINGEFDNKKKLSNDNFGLSGSVNYPFVMADGMTIYFSAQDENNIGGYDIYITRYNLNNDTYLTPERLNMPFNSTANDYLMVIDENKGVGWFATDRFQPEGKVCIYTFIPNESTKLVESDNEVYLENRAKLASIKDTQEKGKDYNSLRLLAKKETTKKEETVKDFIFVINDRYTYYSLNDFKNPKARNLYKEVTDKSKVLIDTRDDLENKRNEYMDASDNRRGSLSNLILSLENKEASLSQEIKNLEIKARNEEIKSLN